MHAGDVDMTSSLDNEKKCVKDQVRGVNDICIHTLSLHFKIIWWCTGGSDMHTSDLFVWLVVRVEEGS